MKNLLVVLGLVLIAFWSQPPAEAGELKRNMLNGVKTVFVSPVKLTGAVIIIFASLLEQKIDLAIAQDLAKDALKKKAEELPAEPVAEPAEVEGA